MQILVLGGGNSPEREVSLRSAAAVVAGLRAAGFEVVEADPKNGWACLDNLPKDTLVFPILHGAKGEDGQVQKMLEDRQIAFLGSGSEASHNCFDKAIAKKLMAKNCILLVPGEVVDAESYRQSKLAQKPHVLKVLRGGSSIGTLIVRDPASVNKDEVAKVFTYDDKAVVEELIIGTEITVPLIDGKALPVIEIVPPVNAEFDYENKYNGASQELCPAKSVDESIQKQAQEIAEKVNGILGSRHLCRVDMMINKDGQIFVLENNTMPGMTNQSLYPKSAAVAGLPMPDLMKKFVELVKRDYNSRELING